jgi:PAS domain S-box-containing protein
MGRIRWGRMGVIAAAASVPLILLILTTLANRGFDETERLRVEIERSYETRAALNRVLSLHQDIELGQRGYLITGEEAFLTPYRDAQRNVRQSIDALSTADVDPADRERLARLKVDSEAKRRFVERTLALYTQGQRDEARALVSGGEGKRMMDRIRADIAELSRLQRSRLAERTEIAAAARGGLRVQTVALQITLILLLALAVWLVQRSTAARQAALRRAEDSAARQEIIFESAKDGMIVINPSGSIESLNPAAAALFRYDPDALLRRDIGVLFEVAPDRGRVESFLRRLGANRRDANGQVEEFVARRSDLTTIPVEVSISPVRLADVTLYLAVIRDISERREMEQMKTEFVATVSHELRTPLTSIAGSLGLINGGAAGELPAKAARLVGIAHSNSARLVRLINDILDIEKIEAGRMQFDVRPLRLDTLLQNAVVQSSGFAGQLDVRIDLVPPPPNAAVLGDEDRLMQVFANLLSNALKFSPKDGVVTVDVRPLDRRYRISITDRGSGIPEDFRDRIFGKFAQADSSDTRQKGGTGLGLSIVREIVQRLGGSVGFESQRGKGTRFHVDLPAAAAPRPVVEPAPAAELVSEHATTATLPVILHVDDDPDMLDVLVDAFEGRAVLRSTPSVAEARATLRRERIDAAILDIGLLDGCGTDLVSPLRNSQPDLPIIVFTAQEAEQCGAAGVDLVLVKSRATLDVLVNETMLRISQREEANR